MINKRGQIFTLLGLALIVLTFLSIEVYSSIREKQVIRDRVESMDSFLQSIEVNLERQAYISGFRITILAIKEISDTNKFISDVDKFYEEAFFNGTVNGMYNTLMTGLMYQDLADSVNKKASKINVNVTLEDPILRVSQDNPWTIKFEIITNFTMKDKQNLAVWEKEQRIRAYIPIIGFNDPVYLNKSYGKVPRKINQTIYEGIYNVSGNLNNLRDHFNKGYYAANPDAPNFLQRLEGNLSIDPSGNGIETFVDTKELEAQGIPLYDKSVVDHIYFSSSNPGYQTIVGMPAEFKIDVGHKPKYQLA